jgi:hypothetical protein
MTLKAISVVILLSTVLFLFGHNSPKQVASQQQTGIVNDLMDLSLNDLINDSELIVIGNVLDRNSAGTVGESQSGVPENLTMVAGIKNTIQIEKVLKGNYAGNIIDVITEDDFSGRIVFEGSAKLQKGENVRLFLYKEPIYDGLYVIMGMEQGKYRVDSNGLVKGKVTTNATSIA